MNKKNFKVLNPIEFPIHKKDQCFIKYRHDGIYLCTFCKEEIDISTKKGNAQIQFVEIQQPALFLIMQSHITNKLDAIKKLIKPYMIKVRKSLKTGKRMSVEDEYNLNRFRQLNKIGTSVLYTILWITGNHKDTFNNHFIQFHDFEMNGKGTVKPIASKKYIDKKTEEEFLNELNKEIGS